MIADKADEDHLVRVVDDRDDAVAIAVDVEADEAIPKRIGRWQTGLDFVRGLPGIRLNNLPPFSEEAFCVWKPLPELVQGGQAQEAHGLLVESSPDFPENQLYVPNTGNLVVGLAPGSIAKWH